MDSKKTRFSAVISQAAGQRARISRAALCGRYLAFATRDLARGRRCLGLAAGAGQSMVLESSGARGRGQR